MIPQPPRPTLFPYTTLFRSARGRDLRRGRDRVVGHVTGDVAVVVRPGVEGDLLRLQVGSAGGLEGRRSEEHTSELQSHVNLVCRLLLEKKKRTRDCSASCAV